MGNSVSKLDFVTREFRTSAKFTAKPCCDYLGKVLF